LRIEEKRRRRKKGRRERERERVAAKCNHSKNSSV
jgi:hypothetical protein